MTEEKSDTLVKIIVGGVASFVGICFLSVSIWLATTVNNLAKSSVTLEITITNLSRQTEKLSNKVDAIAEEQRKNSINAYRVNHLEAELTALKKRIDKLESK